MSLRASARQLRPALALAASVLAAPSLAQGAAPADENDRNVHRTLAYRQIKMALAFGEQDFRLLRSEAALVDGQVGGGLKVDDPSSCRRAAYHLATFGDLAALLFQGEQIPAVKDAAIRRVERFTAEMRDCGKLVGADDDDAGFLAKAVEMGLPR